MRWRFWFCFKYADSPPDDHDPNLFLEPPKNVTVAFPSDKHDCPNVRAGILKCVAREPQPSEDLLLQQLRALLALLAHLGCHSHACDGLPAGITSLLESDAKTRVQ